MRMRAAVALAAAMSLGGCTAAQLQADEAFVLALIQGLRSGAAVTTADQGRAASMICGYVGDVNADYNKVAGIVGTDTKAMRTASSVLNKAAGFCSSGTVAATTAQLSSLWNAYLAAKAAVAAAKRA